jgi:Fe-S cluster biosynthesis and repair protein YggX
MSPLQERIAQCRKMATDDPDNELGHLLLGQALLEAEQYADAVTSFRRALELNPQLSKAHQLQATALLKLNQREEAVRILKEGVRVAEQMGHNVPKDAMAKMLQQLGEAVPASEKPAAVPGPAPAGGGFQCHRPDCRAGAYARQLPGPPLNDDLGRRIHANICADCWQEWLRNYSIKVINELRLDLSTERGVEVYDQVMREFLGLE